MTPGYGEPIPTRTAAVLPSPFCSLSRRLSLSLSLSPLAAVEELRLRRPSSSAVARGEGSGRSRRRPPLCLPPSPPPWGHCRRPTSSCRCGSAAAVVRRCVCLRRRRRRGTAIVRRRCAVVGARPPSLVPPANPFHRSSRRQTVGTDDSMGKNDRLRPSSSAFRRRGQAQLLHPAGADRRKRHNNNLFDTSDDDSISSVSTSMSELTLDQETERVTSKGPRVGVFLDALFEKRGSTREKALCGLIDAFESRVLLEFIENKSITMLHQCLKSIKKGSSKEASLASRAIGLLAITVGCGSIAHEIMEESIPQLYQALTSGSDSLKKSSVLDCLAIISFVGGEHVEEKEKAMKIIWELIHPKSGSNVTLPKPNPVVLASAISAWSLILSTLNPWSINSSKWQESISFLSTLLDKDDRPVRIAAGEAIALIFEIGRLDKFSREENSNAESNNADIKPPHGGFGYVEALKGKILNQARNLSAEAGGKGSTKNDLNTQRNTFQDIVTLIETGSCPEHALKILKNCEPLVVSTWTQMMQLNFLRRFLGSGFLKHMQDNELLHDVFEYAPRKKDNLSAKEKKMFLSPNSFVNKERTQFLNKRRTWTNDWKQGHFRVGVDDA